MNNRGNRATDKGHRGTNSRDNAKHEKGQKTQEDGGQKKRHLMFSYTGHSYKNEKCPAKLKTCSRCKKKAILRRYADQQ